MLFGLVVGLLASAHLDLELPKSLKEWAVFAIASAIEVLVLGWLFGHWIIGGYIVGELLGRAVNWLVSDDYF